MMRLRLFSGLIFCGLVFPVFSQDEALEVGKNAKKESHGHVFAWPFASWEKMQPRGGTSQGSEVTLVKRPKERWMDIREEGLLAQEKDRRAILALAGSYRVSFDFVETMGLSKDYEPPRPYFSWGTEYVKVLEAREDFVSLQHSLVMFFKEDGEVTGPHVMKHWRQDWQYEDPEIFTYRGDNVWKKMVSPEPKGRWSQSVYQVDDSPRYQVMGRWTHEGKLSTWTSDDCWRPLPRREFSARDDYNVLAGTHQIILGPIGWVHVQNNRKLKVGEKGEVSAVGTELGVDRYEEISEPELAAGFDDYWKNTEPYWAAVRKTWADEFSTHEMIELKGKDEGEMLWQVHFQDADDFSEDPKVFEVDKRAKEVVERFLEVP